MTAISLASAVCALVCALIATFASRNCARLSAQLEATLSALSAERGRIAAHDSQIDQIRDDFRSLRGKFYAERRSSPPIDAAPKSASDLKAELRQQVGLVPGRRN